ncbi:ABC transporter permease subunit [Nostoc sp. CENA67]|uniref:ABC transporter permease subunit n=1 Tax=Amazonocrinis nigriterrae CENA67 TaxID=2794033 RepID=A0A8J7LAE7_9NOST|nr:ABC transporter permease [Amazonocrinis nigriterrae]MBH8566584.1 ABC transporter permease subunit [Amazonocrinis nigriterrae CENA67]
MTITKIFVIAKNVFQEVVRDRILYVIGFYAVILAVAIRVLPEFSASTENKMFLDFGMVAMSVITLVIAIFVGTGLVNKEIEKRTVLVLIAKPVSRSEIISGKFLGLLAVLAVLVATMTTIYLIFLQFGNIPHQRASILIAAAFLFLQLSLIAAVAITFGVLTSSLLAITLTFAVYLMGNITQDIVKFGRLTRNEVIELFAQILYLIIPDLSRLDFKNEAVYGLQALPDLTALITNVVYGLFYSVMLLAIAIYIFSKREF